MQLISSRENPSVKLYCKLCGSKKARCEENKFTLEGLRLIEDAVKENAELHHIFVAESFFEKHGEALNFLPKDKLTLVTEQTVGKMALTDKSQGIFAICGMKKLKKAADIVCENGKYIMLHNIQDPGNMGTIIRTADAVGINGIITADCCDIYNPKVVRATMGSLFRANIADTDADEAFAAFDKNRVVTYAAVIDENAKSLTECQFERGAAAVIGNEGNGLPSELAARCNNLLTIKMHGNINSLNAATAAAIIMWELTK